MSLLPLKQSACNQPILPPVFALLFFVFFLFAFKQNTSAQPALRNSASLATTLVIVPGHGIFTFQDEWDVDPWLIPFIPDIEAQIKYAVTHYSSPQHLIVFSGGQTHINAGPISEAESYFHVASKHLHLNKFLAHVSLEEFALDSFQNLLFSICKFKQETGKYPLKIIVVGFEFKRQRFEQEHRRAIRFSNFEYVGIGGNAQKQIDMENTGTRLQFQADPYACDPPLSTKREERNVFFRHAHYDKTCKEIKGLFKACGSEIYAGELPWE